jgi:transcriptional regulator with XRE-family HTH domain
MPAKPPSPTALFLDHALAQSGKTQREIGEEIGLPKPNALSMMKNGTCKVPVDRIPALAKACGVDPAVFLSIAMEEYEPEAWAVLQGIFGGLLSEDERRWLGILRALRKRKAITVNTDLWLAVFTFAGTFKQKRPPRRRP